MEPITLILLGAGGFYVWKKNQNPEWSPLTWITSTPLDKAVALERVKVASVPTPAPTAALDPGMSTDQVKQVNHSLTTETDHDKIKAHADALGSLGHGSSAAALDAKAKAVGEAKAHGASDSEIHGKQIEAQAPAAVGWGMPGYPFGDYPAHDYSYHPEVTGLAATGADSVFGTHSYGYPWSEASFGHSHHPEHMAGIQTGPAIVGVQSGPAIVGVQSGPAIVGVQSGPAIVGWDGGYGWGYPWHHHHHHHRPWEQQQFGWPEGGDVSVGWDLFAHGVPAGGDGARPGWGHPQHPHHPQQQHRGDWGRHGRFAPHHGRERWEHMRHRPEWEEHMRRRRHFRRPEEVIVEEEPMFEPEPELETEVVEEVMPEEVHVEHEHHHREMPPPPQPPPPKVQVTPGIVTNGWWHDPVVGGGWWEDPVVGFAQYGGGGLVSEFPGVPQQAQPYGPPVGQYGQQYAQQYAQPGVQAYGEDLLQEYAEAIEPQLEGYYQQPQQYYYRRRRPWGGGYRRRRWW